MSAMTRLPGRATKGFGFTTMRYQLWLTPEYLMAREIAGYRETVKRYYYNDIQAIVSGPTRHAFWCTVVTATLVAIFGGLTAYVIISDVPDPVAILPGFVAAIALPILIGNLILGPTCKTTLYTATSEARLFSLGRQRATNRAIERILPYIENSQGNTVPDRMPSAPEAASAPAGFAQPAPAQESFEPQPPGYGPQ